MDPLESSSEGVNLEDPGFLAEFRGRHLPQGEQSATAVLRMYYNALNSYSAKFPEAGFPPDQEALGPGNTPDDIDEQHAGMVERSFLTKPLEREGYRLEYRPDLSNSPCRNFDLLARPVYYPGTGRRSFVIDQRGFIHFTERTENRRSRTTNFDPNPWSSPRRFKVRPLQTPRVRPGCVRRGRNHLPYLGTCPVS
jgi:hypothetical protein